ncbi:hypothetical protein [Saccharopolyspora shandongensis]|uniref:hypothetical protein n=1 Tax=Saccharopolyspora shandongensis TaxID=418495 RepID=UPI0033C5DB1A
MCYASSAKEYRKQMGGSPDAASLPVPKDHGIETWTRVAAAFKDIVNDIEHAIRLAESGHQGQAAAAASASIAEIKPFAEAAATTSLGVKAALEEQATYQREAFQSLPAQGDTLPSGQEAQLDPPQKGWVEDWGLDSNPVTGWMSDYEDRQQAYVDTNQQANAAMERYSAQTEGVIARMPEFQPADQPPPPPQQPPGTSTQTPTGYSSSSDTSNYSSGLSTSATPAGTSSSWASPPTPHPPSYVPPSSPPPASSTPSWAPTPGTLPPGVVRGPDGTLFRQNPQTGAWERQNPYNGRWAPSPNGGPGGSGMRGGMGRGLGPGAGGQLGAGGRAGVGSLGSGPGASGSATAGAGARGGTGATGGGAGGAGRGKPQGEEDQEHERPGWLMEDDDVFTNDMEKVAPPVFGDFSDEGR